MRLAIPMRILKLITFPVALSSAKGSILVCEKAASVDFDEDASQTDPAGGRSENHRRSKVTAKAPRWRGAATLPTIMSKSTAITELNVPYTFPKLP